MIDHAKLAIIQDDLDTEKKILADRVAHLRALRQQVRNAAALVELQQVAVARVAKRRSRAITGKD